MTENTTDELQKAERILLDQCPECGKPLSAQCVHVQYQLFCAQVDEFMTICDTAIELLEKELSETS